MGKLKKLFHNDYIFSILARLITVAVGIFHAAFLARFLGPSLKGVSASINSAVSVGCIIVTGGIHQAFPYYRKSDPSKGFIDKFCSNVVIIYAVLFVLGIGLFSVSPYGIITNGTILLIPLFGYEMIINYVFLIENPKLRNSVNVIAGFIETFALFIFWVALKPNNALMLVGISLSVIIRAVVSTKLLNFSFSFKAFDVKYLLGLLKFGFLPMLALLLTILNARVDILMLNAYKSVSFADVGIYSVGVGLAEKALLIPDAIREILLGKLVYGKDTGEVSKACRIGTFISFFVSICVLIFGNIVIAILYGVDYESAYTVTMISSFGTIFMVYIKMISQYNIVYKMQKTNALLLMVSVGVNVILNLALIPNMGITGAAVATLVGHFTCGLCFILFFMHATGEKFTNVVFMRRGDFEMLKSLIGRKK